MNYLPVKSFVTHEMWRLREGMNKDDNEGSDWRDCLGGDGIIQNGRGGRRKASWLEKNNVLHLEHLKLALLWKFWSR